MDEMAPPAIRAILSEDDDDHVPMFPSVNSAQRHAVSGSAPSSRLHPSGMSSLRAPVEPAPSQLEVPMRRQKVILEPGHSPLDWARLKMTTDLRGGVSTLLRVTPSQLKQHNRLDDAWTAIQGKVYNMTPYLKFHPGGVDQLMRIAGRDGTRLFCALSYSLTCSCHASLGQCRRTHRLYDGRRICARIVTSSVV